LNAVYKAFLRKILDGAAGKMIELAQQRQARPLMCSELVFLCFHNAPTMPQGALSLAIAGLDVGGNNSEAWLKPTGPEHGSLLDLIKRRSSPADLPDAMRGPTRDDSFSEGTATLPDDFALLLEACESSPPSSTESTEGTLDADTAKSIQGLAEALRQLETPARGEPSLDEGLRDPPGAKDIEKWLSHFVSPRDLEQSPTLEQVGRLILT
jgi:hypothetical protein